MTTAQKKTGKDNAIDEFVSGLDVDAVGTINLADWEGTKLGDSALRLLPQARSVVVFAMEVYPEILAHAKPGKEAGQASLNDLLAHTADYLNGRLTRAAYDVARASHNNGLRALPLPAAGCPLDARFLEAVFSYKHAGQAAGLGYIGHSSLLITRDFGPRVRLSCCLTEALLEPTGGGIASVCQHCQVCIKKCPAGAIAAPPGEEPYSINKFACSAFRNASGGCAECMRLCPAEKRMNKL